MSFEKAVRNIDPAAYEEYWKELALYKGASKAFRNINKLYKNSTDPAEKLLYFTSREIYREACKRFAAARQKWENIAARARLREGTAVSSDAAVARLLGIKIPKTVKDLAEIQKQDKLEEDFKAGKMKDIVESLAQYAKEKQALAPTEAEQFLHPTDEAHEVRPDPTDGDFEPL